MTPFNDWLAYLTDPSTPSPPGSDTSAAGDAQILPVPYLGALRVQGTEAQAFLANLLSCEGPDEMSRRGALCSAKGRMITMFNVAPDPDGGYLLTLPRELLESARNRLAMYVLRAKVTIDELPAQRVLVGVSGALDESAAGALASLGVLHRHPDAQGRYYGHFDHDALASWFAAQHSVPATATAHYWRLMDIREGLPSVWAATTEQFIPQMTNLDLLGGVSFTKGCYPGQEIVARMRYLGQIKRRMLYFTSDAVLTAGDQVRTADGGEAAGIVVDAIADSGRCEGLAVIRLDTLERPLVVGSGAGDEAPLELSAPPYPVPELTDRLA